MSEWRAAIIRWRCALSPEETGKYGVSTNSSCRDLKFFVGLVNFDELGRQRADVLKSIPTRFKLAPDTVEQVIGAARDAFQAFLASRSQRQRSPEVLQSAPNSERLFLATGMRLFFTESQGTRRE
jgi:hypothetical protein